VACGDDPGEAASAAPGDGGSAGVGAVASGAGGEASTGGTAGTGGASGSGGADASGGSGAIAGAAGGGQPSDAGAGGAAGDFGSDWPSAAYPYDQMTPGNLVWSDEFEGTDLDETNWNVVNEAWEPNNELEFYTGRPENLRVEDGLLVIEAHREAYQGRDFTSARIHSADQREFQYGIVTARISLPDGGQGLWPAFWMMGENRYEGAGWPDAGEIDIMEHKGSEPDHVSGALHAPAYDTHGDYFATGSLQAEFHDYTLVWEPSSLQWYVDDELFETRTDAPPVFDSQRFFILLNLAVGGHFDGDPTDATVFPAQLRVDWVRVYQP